MTRWCACRYFRLKHIKHGTEAMERQLVDDMWADLEGMRHVAAATSAQTGQCT